MKRGHHDIAVEAFEVNVPVPKVPKPTEAIASQDDTVAQVFHVYRKA